jgi:2-keto-3-deoxy-L-rhamnonate aldolase RhmA
MSRILSGGKVDAVIVDTEYGDISEYAMHQDVQGIKALSPLVPFLFKRALDCGAWRIIVPLVIPLRMQNLLLLPAYTLL